jgi:biotin synthase
VEGTPLGNLPIIDPIILVRMIATARILMPKAMVRLSAGRDQLTTSDQALCFLAGANSIFSSDKLLTTSNPSLDRDAEMFDQLGIAAMT